MPRPIGEPVSQCSICGNDFPESELQRHYKTGRLVDRLCADEPGASDYLEQLKLPETEGTRRAKQPVPKTEEGFTAANWATVTVAAAAGTGATASVTGDNRNGIVTVVAGSSPLAGPADLFAVIFGTALGAAPSAVLLSPWDPNSERIPVSVAVPLVSTGLTARLASSTTLQAFVTYQWRYQIRS